jgi:hypothetical protein
MIELNKTKARKMFWLALLLFIISQMCQVFAKPSKDFISDMSTSLASGIGLFPLGILYPVKRVMDYTSYNQVSGDPLYNMSSIFFLFLAALTLLWGARIYAQGKGLPEIIGYLGLFGFAGIAVLLVLPDKTKSRRFQ